MCTARRIPRAPRDDDTTPIRRTPVQHNSTGTVRQEMEYEYEQGAGVPPPACSWYESYAPYEYKVSGLRSELEFPPQEIKDVRELYERRETYEYGTRVRVQYSSLEQRSQQAEPCGGLRGALRVRVRDDSQQYRTVLQYRYEYYRRVNSNRALLIFVFDFVSVLVSVSVSVSVCVSVWGYSFLQVALNALICMQHDRVFYY